MNLVNYSIVKKKVIVSSNKKYIKVIIFLYKKLFKHRILKQHELN